MAVVVPAVALTFSPDAKMRGYRKPVPPHRWHFTTLSPFFSSPLPSQFLHFCFFLMLGPFWLVMTFLPTTTKQGDGAAQYKLIALTSGGIPIYNRGRSLNGNKMSDIVNNKAHHRYELAVDGHIAATYYKIADGVITFIHTEVPPELGGKGIGSKLIKGALDQVRSEGLKVIAQCPFVKAYIDKHPDYADLLK